MKNNPYAILNREPKNDIERVIIKWLSNYKELFGEQPIIISWNIVSPLIKNILEQVRVEKILNILDIAMKDNFCLETGYILKIILSSNVINRLIHSSSGQKHKIKSDNISPKDYGKYIRMS
jgi:hypothetical protein